MSRHVLLVLLCGTLTGCATLRTWHDDYCDHFCEKDPVQAAMLRAYKQETKDYLCRPFMPLEVTQTLTPHLAPGITDLSSLNVSNGQMSTYVTPPVQAAGPETDNVPPPPAAEPPPAQP